MSAACPNCGKTVPLDSATCPSCGYSLSPADQETIQVDLSNVPPVSTMATTDAGFLRRGVMGPPPRPGVRGRIGRFEVLRLIGRGGMAYVYLAREPVTETNVAVKVLREELSEIPRVVKYFLAEARHMYAMSHPNILKVLEVSNEEDGPFFVMPYLPNGNLSSRIEHGKPLPGDEILPIAVQVATGLEYAHNRGLIHRDLKPDNVLIGEEGQALLTDFGLVRTVFNDSLLDVRKTRVEGTPAYMSPGVAAGQAEDTRCDIYSFGAMLYMMLTGYSPYELSDPEAMLEAIKAGPPVAITTRQPSAPPHLVPIAEGCMARELRDRYASMADVSADLKRAGERQRPLGPHGQAAKNTIPGWVKAAVAVLVGAAAVWGGVQLRNRTETQKPTPFSGATPILSTSSPDAAALLALSEKYSQQGNRHQATEHLRQAFNLDRSNPVIAERTVAHIFGEGHYHSALNIAGQWLMADPESEQAAEWKAKIEAALKENPVRLGPSAGGQAGRRAPPDRRDGPRSPQPSR